MPAPKTDTAPQEAAGPVNVLTPEEMQDYIAELEARLIEQTERIDAVLQRTEAVEEHHPPPQKISPPTLPEGAKRYWHQFTEASVFRQGAWKEVINGYPISHPPVVADFKGHVYTTSDPEMQEWLDNHPDNGVTFYEDPTALPEHNRPGIIEGARGSENTVRNPLEAPIP